MMMKYFQYSWWMLSEDKNETNLDENLYGLSMAILNTKYEHTTGEEVTCEQIYQI